MFEQALEEDGLVSSEWDAAEPGPAKRRYELTESGHELLRAWAKALAQTQRDIAQEEQALKVIEQDQSRMRANMERVPPTSEAYKRYLKKFDDQETEIEKRRAKIVELQQSAEQQRKAYETFLTNLTVE